jgi:glycine dehydrogenase
MVTYPSTHGVFEDGIGDICAAVHDAGGQVYVDGANLNALVGLAKPGRFGADVSHLNLHKTFCIPHGGGGPASARWRAGAPGALPAEPPARRRAGPATGPGPVSAAPYGSAGILPISWRTSGSWGREGLTRATQVAVLNAKLRRAPLQPHFPVLYTGRRRAGRARVHRRPAADHEGDGRHRRRRRQAAVDYGFHAPTMSFPVAGTLMIEPTGERGPRRARPLLRRDDRDPQGDRRGRRRRWPGRQPPLRHAPHTASAGVSEEWSGAPVPARDWRPTRPACP